MLHLQMKENRSYDEEQRLRRLQTEEEFDRRAMQEQVCVLFETLLVYLLLLFFNFNQVGR